MDRKLYLTRNSKFFHKLAINKSLPYNNARITSRRLSFTLNIEWGIFYTL